MQFRNILVGIAVFTVLLAPSLTYAAWWNPASWFRKPATPPVAKVVQVATTTPRAVKKEIPVMVTKPAVTLPVKTDQAAEIGKLRKEVVELKKQQASNQPAVITQPVTSVPTTPPVENAYLKVERCKARREQQRATMYELITKIEDAAMPNLIARIRQVVGEPSAENPISPDTFTSLVSSIRASDIAEGRAKSDISVNDAYVKCINN